MNAKNSDMSQWISDVHKELSEKIESEKSALSERSTKRRQIQYSVKESLDALCKNYEEILFDFKTQTSDISCNEDQIEKDFKENLNELKKCLISFEELAEKRKELRKTVSKRDDNLMKSLENNASKLKEVKQPLMDLCNSEVTVEEDKATLNEMLAVLDMNKFSVKQESLNKSQNKVVSEFKTFTKDYEKEEGSMFSETENALKNHLSSISERLQSVSSNITEVNSSLESYTKSGETSVQENIEEIQKIILKTKENVNQSEEVLSSSATELKHEVLKRDMEFEKFISEDLLKDIPTGTTPQRKHYNYPRYLVATSPHERILQRYRTELAAQTALAINLPLNSSFNELDEIKDSPVSLNKSTDAIDVNNISFSSDDSAGCDTDSYASSVSDASIDSERNKENKRNLKKSRLPKRLPKKGFLKPATPQARKPLITTNSSVTE